MNILLLKTFTFRNFLRCVALFFHFTYWKRKCRCNAPLASYVFPKKNVINLLPATKTSTATTSWLYKNLNFATLMKESSFRKIRCKFSVIFGLPENTSPHWAEKDEKYRLESFRKESAERLEEGWVKHFGSDFKIENVTWDVSNL